MDILHICGMRNFLNLTIIITNNSRHNVSHQAAYPYSLRRAVKLFGLGGVASLAQEVSGRLRELGMEDTLVTMHTKELNI